MYAIVEIRGKQYKVQEGDIIFVDRMIIFCYVYQVVRVKIKHLVLKARCLIATEKILELLTPDISIEIAIAHWRL